MMWWYGPGMSGWGFALMTVGTIFFRTLIILGVIAVIRYLLTGGDRLPEAGSEAHPTPEELLAERFARGEIDEQDYRRRLDVLHGRPDTVINP
jgi:putative membrane protein